MGEAPGKILSQLQTCETKQVMCKIQHWDRHKIVMPIPKGRNQKEEGGDGSQTSLKASKANSKRA